MSPDNIDKNTYDLERALKREKSIRFTLLAILAIMTIAFISKSSETNTILTPVGATEGRYAISDNKASQEYLQDITEEVAQLGFTYNPATANKQFDKLLTLVDPESYGALNKVLIRKKEQIRKNNVSSVFFANEYSFDLENQRVIAKGVLKTFSGDKPVGDKATSLLFEYRVVSQKIRLLGYTDVTGLRNPFTANIKEK